MKYKTNPWTLVISILLTALVVGVGTYFWQMQKATSEMTMQKQEEGTRYENSIYRFSLVFPASWGAIQERVENAKSPIYQTIRLTSEDDPERYIQIQVVKIENKNDPAIVDYPHIYLTENSTWSFYYLGGGDYAGLPGFEDEKFFDIKNEVKTISETFKTF